MVTTAKAEEWLWRKAKTAAERWFTSQCMDPFARFYLYHKRGDLTIAQEDQLSGDYELSDPRRISPAWTVGQTTQWIYNQARKLPCLPENEEDYDA